LPRLHIVGDSISIQYGPFLEPMLAGILAYSRKTGEAGNLDDLEGANAGDSSMVVQYLKSIRDHTRMPIGYLIVNCGLHDIKRQLPAEEIEIPLERYAKNLREIVALAREISRTLIWVRTTPVVDQIHNRPGMQFHRYAADANAYNTAADETMKSEGVRAIDLFTFTKNLGESVYCDHVHFIDSVRAQQAAFIAGQLYQLVQKG
jgi:hypothetical protein